MIPVELWHRTYIDRLIDQPYRTREAAEAATIERTREGERTNFGVVRYVLAPAALPEEE